MVTTWENINTWDLVLPPSRPDFYEINRIKQIANEIDKDSKIAILGSTPEFRDLFVELNFSNIYIFEKSESFYKKMSDYRLYNNNEIVVKGDWIETLVNYEDSFSIIVSDLTSGNIPYVYRSKFYKLIQRSLIKKWIFYR